MLSSAHFPHKSKRLDYWSLGTKNGLQLFIRFVPSFPVNIFPFHKLINLLFPEIEKKAFGSGWAWSVWFSTRHHQLLSWGRGVGAAVTSGRGRCRLPWGMELGQCSHGLASASQ